MANQPVPFTLAVPDSDIQRLHAKLESSTLPNEVDGAGWDYGAPLADIKRLVERWRTGYDWRKVEQEINDTYPMFTIDIPVDGFGTLNIHYAHKESSCPNAIPLLFVHGWPGSILEVGKLLPHLISESPEHPSFHVVAFSLPGFGFSEPPLKRGFATAQYAEVGHKLMLALGYNEYVTQGGDLGFWITRIIGKKYGPKHSKAWHTNFTVSEPPKFLDTPLLYLRHLITPYTEREKASLARQREWLARGRGYFAEHSTQPQTLAYSLTDSPVGLLAWIYEKLVRWTDDDYQWDDDEVLTWVSWYWFSRGGPMSSLLIYYEMVHNSDRKFTSAEAPSIPMGVSHFPKEVFPAPRLWIHATGNLVFESEHDRGGHFAAHEKPLDLVSDVQNMFGRGGPAYGVVPGRTGYA